MLKTTCFRQSLRYVPRRRHFARIATKADDEHLRQVFNTTQGSWKTTLKDRFKSTSVGLLKNKYLVRPDGFPRFAQDSLHKAQVIASYVSSHHHEMIARDVIASFDRLSDTLCSVLDLAEFVRNSHPDEQYVDAAESAYAILYDFMNTLNTHTGLFEALRHIKHTERITQLNVQEKAVLEVLLTDFYRSGVHLTDDVRAKFVALSAEASKAERLAFTDYAPAEKEIRLTVDEAKGLWPNMDRSMMTSDGKVKIPTTGWEADSAMQRLDLPDSRRKLQLAMQTPRTDQLANLDSLFKIRGQLAKVVGSRSSGDSLLGKQMAKSPAQVETFLVKFADAVRPTAIKEYAMLADLKRRHLQLSGEPSLQHWDEDYYSASYLRNQERNPVAELSPYLSIGTVIEGLSRLFDYLYGIRFVVKDLDPGESWHSDVQKLDVVRDGILIGALYCDLYSRPGKNTGLAAHFTLRCGRRTRATQLLPGEPEVESGMLSGQINGEEYQLPVIALQCSFSPAGSNAFATLNFHEVSTLFHEMGHAIHSMLGLKEYQTIAGTRVAADFVELPSQLMESFAESPKVWPLFARHWSTNKPAPYELLEKTIRSTKQLGALQHYRQFMRALLDQRYHSPLALEDDFDSTQILNSLEQQYGLIGKGDHIHPWQVQFTHFAGYGGTYYSYMFDKAIANRIFTKTFQQDPVSRESGENFAQNLLMHGGAKDPWSCIADVLNQPALALGDAKAMAEVGRWSTLID